MGKGIPRRARTDNCAPEALARIRTKEYDGGRTGHVHVIYRSAAPWQQGNNNNNRVTMHRGDRQGSYRSIINDQVHAECVRLLFVLSERAMIGSAAGSSLIVAVLWSAAPRPLLLAWVAMMTLVSGLSYVLLLAYRKARPRPAQTRRWEDLYAGQAVLFGLAWGMLVWLLFPTGEPAHQVMLIVTLCTVGLLATGTLITSRRAYLAFLAAAVGPAAIRMAAFSPVPLAAAGGGMIIYLLFLLGVHDSLHRLIRSSIARRIGSDAIAQEQQVIFDSAAEAIGFFRPHYLVKCNRQWCELFGCTMEEALGKPAWTWYPSYDDWQDLARACRATLAAGGVFRRVVQLRRKNGELFPAEIHGKAVDPHNLDQGVVWMGYDISERIRTEAELRASERRFRDLVSLSTDWYWEIDREFRFSRISGGAFEEHGHPVHKVLGKRRWELEYIRGVTPEQWRAHRETLEAHLPFRDFCYRVVTDQGEERWFSVSGNPAYDENGDFAGYHGVGSDITERLLIAEQFRHLAHHDSLTGVPNRRLLADRLEQAIARARREGNRVVVMLLDLDDFKIINDTHGHSVGDEVLMTVAHRLRASVRESDTVARFGGDEFVVLLPNTHQAADAVTVAEKILEALREPVRAGEAYYQLGVSIGIAVFPDHADDAERLLQNADIAMYQAKRRGGRAFHFSGAAIEAGGQRSTTRVRR
jgi:diguanylate cyclase (GGDEF)-like protein/PAS domain S-box-containing protein